MEHQYITPETCQANHEYPGCNVCDGGLGICEICGLAEGCLTTECPGVESYGEYGQTVYIGEIDYRDGKWVVGACTPHSPAFYRKEKHMTHQNDNCEICGNMRVGESPECDAVFADYPQLVEMEDLDAKSVLVEAFREAHKLRCEFMHWLIKMGFAVPDPNFKPLTRLENEVVATIYKLPDGLELHPQAMIELEEQLQQMALTGNLTTLRENAKLYIERFKNFIWSRHQMLTPEQQ